MRAEQSRDERSKTASQILGSPGSGKKDSNFYRISLPLLNGLRPQTNSLSLGTNKYAKRRLEGYMTALYENAGPEKEQAEKRTTEAEGKPCRKKDACFADLWGSLQGLFSQTLRGLDWAGSNEECHIYCGLGKDEGSA
ncbi:hypothetical protein llap_5407 [Limosa lapponica baueri]|uniref:Uncharacterized protein n=1 Tax=Limosa lapponica baueri TaxID=1758121 RepID=A0A2I0UDZ6_LIMLA|nr:hypothetical protein llap_5407 [Limosa lapponica baueri]